MAALRLRSYPSGLLLLLGCSLLASCEGPPSAAQPLHPGDVRTFVTPGVAAQLTPEGRFALGGPAPERYPQITPEKAAEIAVAWVRTFGRFHARYLEGQHGRPIDFNRLQVISPVYYAAAAYDPVPENASAGARNAFGPHYLLYLGVRGEPVLSVSVAAFTQAWVHGGELYVPRDYGGDVVGQGVSATMGFGAPPSPEQAVRIAGTAGGVRAAAVPELIMPHRDFMPHHARWRITLDQPMRVRERRTGRVQHTRELYVGLRGEMFVASPVQPGESDESADAAGQGFRLARREGRPVDFAPVVPV